MFWKKIVSLVFGLSLVLVLAGTGQAATITDFVEGNPVYAPDSNNAVFVIVNKLDFADISNYVNGGVSTADVVQLLDIPAGMIVTEAGLRINTATSTSSCTDFSCDLGDGVDPDGWLTEFEVGASASGVSSSMEEGYAGVYHTTYGGKYYSAADTLDLVIPTLTANVWALNRHVSGLTDFVVEAWIKGFMAPTQKAYGTVD